MSKATRVGDINTGHDSCAPVPLVSGSPDVFINGRAAGRVGDAYAVHGCDVHPSHSGHIFSGSLQGVWGIQSPAGARSLKAPRMCL